MSADILLSRLEGVRDRGHGRWMASCCSGLHDDRNPSLSIHETADGTVLIKCFAGCSAAEIVAGVGLTLADLFPEKLTHHRAPLRNRVPAADRELIERAKRQEQAERERRHADAADRARTLWERAQPATSHGYLTAKGIKPYGARTLSGLLALPVQDFDGQIHSLQFIAGDGGKKLLSGGQKKGRFISVRWTGADRLLICEGFATGASLAEIEQGSDVLAAIDAGNLLHVACEARRRFPGREIVICADNDPVGVEKAHAAAAASRALVAIPETEGADFNDMHRREVAAW